MYNRNDKKIIRMKKYNYTNLITRSQHCDESLNISICKIYIVEQMRF